MADTFRIVHVADHTEQRSDGVVFCSPNTLELGVIQTVTRCAMPLVHPVAAAEMGPPATTKVADPVSSCGTGRR
jgi:hypothetical protein